jgi:hypothetical protein
VFYKIPNIKSQIPSRTQIPNIKSQIPAGPNSKFQLFDPMGFGILIFGIYIK